jgi:hypothetical protein
MDISGGLFSLAPAGLEPIGDPSESLAPFNQISHTFALGVQNPHKKRRRQIKPNIVMKKLAWTTRITTLAEPGHIRILDPPLGDIFTLDLWSHDMTLTEWSEAIAEAERPQTSPTLIPNDYGERVRAVFTANQRKRWLARIVYQRWSQLVMKRRTQCNVDLIEMGPVADADALFFTDTKHRQMYRFHYRDVFTNLMSNICLSDEMLPTPRPPTNPWTNAKLTLAQTIGICQHLAADYGRRAKCPPVLFSAFWASRFDLRRFRQENSSLLAQYAIASYFKDLHDDNMGVVYDTIFNLLSASMLHFSPAAIRRWLAQPQTPLHREWLALVRDYTMYMNLHVQTRARWTSDLIIYAEAEDLYHRIGLAQQNNQTITHEQNMNNIALISTITLPIDQLLLIQNALLRL